MYFAITSIYERRQLLGMAVAQRHSRVHNQCIGKLKLRARKGDDPFCIKLSQTHRQVLLYLLDHLSSRRLAERTYDCLGALRIPIPSIESASHRYCYTTLLT